MSLLRQDSVYGRGSSGGRSEVPQDVLQVYPMQQDAGQVRMARLVAVLVMATRMAVLLRDTCYLVELMVIQLMLCCHTVQL